jgi:hypothetical protein
MTEKFREKPNEKIDEYLNKLATSWDVSKDTTKIKLTEFTKYVPKNSLMQFISRYELYKLIENIPGDIIELGVCGGKGLFSFVQSVFINEPQYQWRNIIGFDTFEGFPNISEKDNLNNASHLKNLNSFCEDSYEELIELKKIHEDFRFLNTREQIKLVKGDLADTLPKYIKEHNGLIVSLLYCDLDLYEPTKLALELLWDRIPKGGIIVFDNAIMDTWEGEAIAFHEALQIGKCKLVKIPYIKQFYLVKE